MDKTPEELAIEAKLKAKGVGGDEESTEVEETVEVIEEEPEVVEVESEQAESHLTEQEERASVDGWMPEKAWVEAGNDPDDWVPAKQFLKNGELFRKIHNQNRRIKQLDSVVVTLAKQQKKIFDAGYDKAKREVKAAIRQATKEGDDATAEMLEGRLTEIETQQKEDTKQLDGAVDNPQENKQTANPEFVTWVAQNPWFMQYPEMRAYAEAIGTQYAQLHADEGITNSDVYSHVTKQVKAKFPEKFGTVKKTITKKPNSPVEGSAPVRNRTGDNTVQRVSLTAEEKQVGRVLVEKGMYKNLNEYATDLKKFAVKS